MIMLYYVTANWATQAVTKAAQRWKHYARLDPKLK